MEEQKMSVSEAVNELTRFSNVFRAAERLREALQVITNLEGEKNVIMQAIRQAEAKKAPALREADLAEAKLKEKQAELDGFVRSFDQRKASAAAKFQADIDGLEGEYLKKRDQLSSELARQSSENQERIQALDSRRGDLQKEVKELESRLRGLKERAAEIVRA